MIRSVHLITNPTGGMGDNADLARRARAFLEARGIRTQVHWTERSGHARELAERLECSRDGALCGIGGDGTMHELINGIMRRAEPALLPLALLPGGTGNSFLRDLDCLDPQAALQRLVSGARRAIDLFEVRMGRHTTFGFNLVGWGLVSAANRLAEKLRRVGRRRYDLAGLWAILTRRTYQGALEVDGGSITGEFTLIAGCNTRYAGAGMLLAPPAKLNDGKLDVIYVRGMSHARLILLFLKLRAGGHFGRRGVHHVQAERLRLTTSEGVPVNVDGELIKGGSFEVRVRPGVLTVLL